MAIDDARAWVEVNLESVRANYDAVRRAAAPAAVLPMVKADAYGLGAGRVVRTLEPLGPWGYGIATASEGAALRSLGVERPILVVTPLAPPELELAARHRLTATIASLDALTAWEAAAARAGHGLDYHIEIDTGMGRCGFDWRGTAALGEAVRARPGGAARCTGVFTHFHSADAPDGAAAAEQWERLQRALVQLPVPAGVVVHAANSAAALRWPEYRGDLVRPGIFLYGGSPAPGVAGVPSPAPVASLRARLALVREVAGGSTAGYGATYAARGEERWGTVSIGYGDGLPRVLGNRAAALVRGVRVPVIGRISMDVITVRLDGVPDARPGDVVTLIGRDGAEEITLDAVAERAGTIGYEILTGLGPRLPRVESEGTGLSSRKAIDAA